MRQQSRCRILLVETGCRFFRGRFRLRPISNRPAGYLDVDHVESGRFMLKSVSVRSIRGAIAAVFVVVVAGCGGGGPQFTLTPVSGKVTLDDQPLVGARVMFVPIATDPTSVKEALPPSSGFTDEQGHYTVATFQGQPGAVAGDHRVVVSKMTTPDGKPLTADIKDPALLGPIKESIPVKYSDPMGSELKVIVGFDAEEHDFALKSK